MANRGYGVLSRPRSKLASEQFAPRCKDLWIIARLENRIGAGALDSISSLTNMKTAHRRQYIMCRVMLRHSVVYGVQGAVQLPRTRGALAQKIIDLFVGTADRKTSRPGWRLSPSVAKPRELVRRYQATPLPVVEPRAVCVPSDEARRPTSR